MIFPRTYNLPPIVRRSDYSLVIQLMRFTNEPLDLDQYIVLSQLWDRRRETKHADFLITAIDHANAILKLSLTSQETTGLPTAGVYDVKIIEVTPSGPVAGNPKEYYVMRGSFTSTEGYTDD